MVAKVDVGDGAPGFDVEVAGGGRIRLSDYRGRWLVLYFYPRDNTPGCTQQAKDFSALLEPLSALGADVLGISRDSIAKHKNFIAKHDLSIALGTDEAGEMCEAYGVWVEKKLYGKVHMGIERSTFLIDPDGQIQAVWRRVKVKEHASSVVEALRALTA